MGTIMADEKILIIDDNEIDCEMCIRHFEREAKHNHNLNGYEFIEASDGATGLKIYEQAKPSCVLLDYGLPDMNGLEVLKYAVENSKRTSRNSLPSPIAMMTGQGDEKIAVQALKNGARDYLVKDSQGSYLRLLPALATKMVEDNYTYAQNQAAQSEIKRLNFHNELILNAINEGIFGLDTSGLITFANPAAAGMFNLSINQLVGQPIYDVLQHLQYDDESYSWEDSPIARTIFSQKVLHSEREKFKPAHGKPFFVEYTSSPITNERQERLGSVVVFQDITRRKMADKYITDLAMHDQLTGLGNRLMFKNQMSAALARAQRYNGKVALLFIDLDNFKQINDTLGHETGDRLLKEVSELLQGLIRENDSVFRMGGDEFTVIAEDVDDQAAALIVANKIIRLFNEHQFTATGDDINVGLSIGVSLYPEHGKTHQLLLRNADIAMYQAKNSRGSEAQIYQSVMAVQLGQRRNIEGRLQKVLECNDLKLFFQPLYNVADQELFGFEALLRWQDKELGSVSPELFIPVMEEVGLIHSIGEWVMATACRDFPGKNTHLRLAINVSPHQLLHPHFIETVSHALEITGANPHQIEFEITENCFIENPTVAADTMIKLREMGIHLVVDDFGMGYSALSYLKNLPVSCIKIDKSFVKGIPTVQEDMALIPAIISMAHSMNIMVVAEGVETKTQFDFLAKHDCDVVQGYYFAKPMPVETLSEFFASKLEEQPKEEKENVETHTS